jgi:peptidase M28-like protein
MRTFLLLALLGAAACTSSSPAADANVEGLSAVAQQIDQARMMDLVTRIADVHFNEAPLDCTSMKNIENPALCHLTRDGAGALMVSELQSLGLTVQRDHNPGTPFDSSNIFADLPGTTHPEEIVLVGAHFDAFWAGADDNSTGVAAVVELARALSQFRFDRTIRFVGFDLEELGLVGSERFTNALQNEKLTMAVVFDCIGYYDATPGSQTTLPGFPSPSSGDFLAVIGNDVSRQRAAELYALNDSLDFIRVIPIIAPRGGTSPATTSLIRSDHLELWLHDQPALFLTDTASFRNANYHLPTDLVSTLNPDLYTKAVQLSAVGLGYWAGGPR